MSSLDTSRLNLHLPDFDSAAAAETARSSFDRMSEIARDAAGGLEIDRHLEEASQRVKAAVQTTAIRAAIARLERELPDTDSGRYDRAYIRGRTQARSMYLGLGLAAGIGAGIAAALLLDPKSGKERREALKARARKLADRSTHAVKDVIDRNRESQEAARAALADPAVPEGITPSEAAAPVEEILSTNSGA